MPGENTEQRLIALEEWRRLLDIARAKEEVDRKHIDKRFDQIEEILKESKTTVKWLYRTIGGATFVYFIQFIMGGGLSAIGAN